jgi:deazaflavin-dependent oxidoreductase (nitroreductase family)
VAVRGRGDSCNVFPYRLAHVNRRVTNPILRPVARWVAPLAIVEHRGRRSGQVYRTPVLAFCRDGTVTIVLSYGDRTQWVRNVIANDGADIVRRGRRSSLVNPRVVPIAERPPTSALERFAYRFADNVFTATLAR